MNIAIAQLNFKIGDFEANTKKIIDQINLAEAQGADLIVFSELAIGGSPALDFLKSANFLSSVEKSIHEIANHCTSIDCIIGAPYLDAKTSKLFNAAIFIQERKIQSIISKKILKDQGEVLETPYFKPGTGSQEVISNNTRILLTFGDDLTASANKADADLIVSLNNVPFSYLEYENRLKNLRSISNKCHSPIIEVNQVGAQGQLIYDGRSILLNEHKVDDKESYFDELNAFDEDLRFYQFDKSEFKALQSKQANVSYSEAALIYKALVFGIRDYFEKNGFKKALLGLSGGLDSALVAALACAALGAENVKGILMPSMYSTDHSIKDAEDLAINLGCEYEIVPIKEGFDVFKKMLEPIFKGAPEDVTEQNIQARVRAVILMSISNKQGHVVLNTSNKSEAAMGYGTLYGDLIGSLSVLGDVYKTQVIEVASYINREEVIIPVNTITKPPSAELAPEQKDSDSLPVYEVLDPILFQLIEKGLSGNEVIELGFDKNEVRRIEQIMSKVGFKLFQTPPALRVSPCAFGSGFKLPLVAKFN